MKSLLPLILAAALTALTLPGCVPLQNTDTSERSVVEEIGGVAFSSLSGAGNLSTAVSASGAPSLSDQATGVSAGQSAPPLAKAGTSTAPDVTIDSSTLGEGYITVTVVEDGLLNITTIVAEIQCESDAGACVENMESGNIITFDVTVAGKGGNVTETATVVDLDGDGVAAGDPTLEQTARVTFTRTNKLTNIYEETIIDVASGPDNNFGDENSTDAAEVAAAEDNRILALSWSKTYDGELINTAVYSDADGDGFVADPNATTPSRVHLNFFDANPFKIFVDSARLMLTVEVTPENEEDRVLAVSGTEYMKNGRVNHISAENADGSATIEPHADVWLTLHTEFPVTEDSLVESEVKILMNVGVGYEDTTDNMIKEIHAGHEARLGPVASATFDFVANPAFPQGTDPEGGDVNMSVTFRNGDTFTVSGSFSPTGLELMITGPDGTFHGKWDAEGNLMDDDSQT